MEQIFNKLVRDKIPEIIISHGESAIYRELSLEEYRNELYKKLIEESNEVISSKTKEELMQELSDVYEVILSIALLEGKTIDDVVNEANKKREKRGGFEKRLFLEKTIK
jgi:predicted house-cleaning noncanonical NTP pyrophosphatase (MazG superfamily)